MVGYSGIAPAEYWSQTSARRKGECFSKLYEKDAGPIRNQQQMNPTVQKEQFYDAYKVK